MPGRRPHAALVALFTVPLPACLHVTAPAKPPESAVTAQPPQIRFAELPRVPGTVVPVRPAPPAPDTTAQKPTEAVRPAVGTEPQPYPLARPAPAAEVPLLAAVRAYTEGRPERAIEIIRTLDKPNQDLVLALLPILARGASADLGNDPATVGALADQLHAAAARLEPRAALRIEKLAFCKDVSGFGRFTPWPADQPYRPNAQAQLYLEVRNLGSQPTADGFVTHVHAAVEVRDASRQIGRADRPGRLETPRPGGEVREAVGQSLAAARLPRAVPLLGARRAGRVHGGTVELRDSSRTAHREDGTPAQFCVAGSVSPVFGFQFSVFSFQFSVFRKNAPQRPACCVSSRAAQLRPDAQPSPPRLSNLNPDAVGRDAHHPELWNRGNLELECHGRNLLSRRYGHARGAGEDCSSRTARRCGSPACPGRASPRWRWHWNRCSSQRGHAAYSLDGDNIRFGMNAGPKILAETRGYAEEQSKRFGLGLLGGRPRGEYPPHRGSGAVVRRCRVVRAHQLYQPVPQGPRRGPQDSRTE